MTAKAHIVESLGESGLLLAQRLDDALAANDRVKYFFTLIQTAVHQATHPLDAPTDLRTVRESCGVDDRSLDALPFHSAVDAAGQLQMPRAAEIGRRIFSDVDLMLLPVRASADAAGAARYSDRLRHLRDRLDLPARDHFSHAEVQRFVDAGHDGEDTVHRLVMDLHRELNRLHASLAVELVDGASVSGATDEDRRWVRAFMRGLNKTAPLKFDHPGLATTAARLRGGLSIQNDLGTTDAHVVVIRVTGMLARVTYSDVHGKRVRFFKEMLAPFALAWTTAPVATEDGAEMIVGEYVAASPDALEQFLAHVGSRLVFLIDWNRARKRCELFVNRRDAIALLQWAADANLGHRGFLQAGDAQLIYTALERGAPDRLRLGMRLDDVLGRDATNSFLRAVLRLTSEGIASGHSERLLQDQIQAELQFLTQASGRDAFDAVADHAMFIWSISERVRATVSQLGLGDPIPFVISSASLAAVWERHADDVARRNLQDGRHRGDPLHADLLAQGDNAADALEEVAFLLTLIAPEDLAGAAMANGIAGLVGEAVRDYVRALECAKAVAASATRADTGELLIAANRVIDAKHAADSAARAVKAAVLRGRPHSQASYLLLDVVAAFGRAAGALAHCAGALRDYALSSTAVRR